MVPGLEGNEQSPSAPRTRVTFIYLGTGTPFAGFVVELARTSKAIPELDAAFVVAAGRPLRAELNNLHVRTLSVPGIERRRRVSIFYDYFKSRNALLGFLEKEHPNLVINLMPHLWSPLMTQAIQKRCGTYATIIHDATPHPGDPSGWITPWLLRDGKLADAVITLSRFVTEELIRKHSFPRQRIHSLFHPDLRARACSGHRQLKQGQPIRLLFYGRILAYKGLSLLVEAVELLHLQGVSASLGVAGAGNIMHLHHRLAAIDAEIINRELSAVETAELLVKYDVMVCSHIEASQSGVAALAFGNAMPVVATPVGGLAEQVIPGRTGVLADDLSARAIAAAIQKLVGTPELYNRISRHLAQTRRDRSMERFISESVSRSLTLSPRSSTLFS